ncbi:MAG: cohesin domain-containing protein [Patescibacteria group bacterium]|nr:cohesin domain-containing protein [Patescibacteria group bacterium]
MKKNIPVLLLSILTFLFVLPFGVRAETGKATLEFKHKNFQDEVIVTDIYLNTGGEKVNTVTADFKYPSKVLEVTAINTDSSLFPYFVEKDFSKPGAVYISCFSLEGVNAEGVIATVTFKSLSSGKAELTFTEDAVVLDVDTSSNILTSTEPALYTISDDLNILPQTGSTDQSVMLGLFVLILLVMIVLFALAGFTIWGGIYFSMGKLKLEGKYEVGLGKSKKEKAVKSKREATSTKKK